MDMTKQQQQLVEDNMKLVYSVMHKKFPHFIHDEDLVQAGMLGLCHAGKTYCEDKGAFSTYAFKSIYNTICNELRRRNKSKGVDIISLDYELDGKDGEPMKIEDIIPGEQDVEFVDISELYNKVSPLDKRILELREQGFTKADVARKLGYSREYIGQRLRLIHRIYNRLYGGNDG